MKSASVAVPRWKESPVEREHDSRRTQRSVALVAALVISVSPFLFYLVEQIRFLGLRYRIDAVRTQSEQLVETERRLRTERAELAALPGIEQRAVRELNLIRPTPEEVLVLSSPKPLGGGGVRAPDARIPVSR